LRLIRRLMKGLALLFGLLLLVLAAPVLWVETMCRPQGAADSYLSLVAPENRRPEGNTLMTWPEWQIVHAYEDYAKVITTSDPQDYAFLPELGRFWSSTCALAKASGPHGGFSGESKQTIYTIGVSFTLELGLKAAYEETLGRLAVALRGPNRADLDDASAQMAGSYAAFLYQTPWYRWDFATDAARLSADTSPGLRNWERRTALGLEFRTKAAYAGLIAKAVAATGYDQLTMRSNVRGLPPEDLAKIPGVTVITNRPEGVEIETPRYAAFTDLAHLLALRGVTFVEIAGNDDILYTALSANPAEPGALMDFPRQGFGDYRHLFLIKVAALSVALKAGGVEHIHDY
jgi:hypothetical protein